VDLTAAEKKYLFIGMLVYTNWPQCTVDGFILQLESSHIACIPPPRQCCSLGGSTIFGLPGVPLCPIESNGNENFKVIKNPGFLPNHPKIVSLVVCAMPDIPSKFQKDPSTTFRVILLTDRQTDKQSLAKTLPPWRR